MINILKCLLGFHEPIGCRVRTIYKYFVSGREFSSYIKESKTIHCKHCDKLLKELK